MEIINWYVKCWHQFADFKTRARRSEFWFFWLINIVIGWILPWISTTLDYIYGLVILIPSLAVGARRLHDTGRSGWWWLIGLIPLVGIIVLIVFWVQDSQREANQWGNNPKA